MMDFLGVIGTLSAAIMLFAATLGSCKDTPLLQEFRDKVELRLVTKDYVPAGVTINPSEKKLPRYKGTVESAKTIPYSSDPLTFNALILKDAVGLFTEKNYGYNPELPSIVVINPPAADATLLVNPIVKALAMRNMVRRYNVFAVDFIRMKQKMEGYTRNSFYGFDARFNELATAIGEVFVEAINQKRLRNDQINLIGFSYSSILSGYVGRYIEGKFNDKINSIFGMDPYSVGLSRLNRQGLSACDAKTVQVFHTDSAGYGTHERKATADFIFNGGRRQPECFRCEGGMASHHKAIRYGVEMILFPDTFRAQKCDSRRKFYKCECEDEKDRVTITYPLNENFKGNYYLNTAEDDPFALGDVGAKCKKKMSEKPPKAQSSTLLDSIANNIVVKKVVKGKDTSLLQ